MFFRNMFCILISAQVYLTMGQKRDYIEVPVAKRQRGVALYEIRVHEATLRWMGRLVSTSTAAAIAIAVATAVAPSMSALRQSRRLRQHQLLLNYFTSLSTSSVTSNRHGRVHAQGVVRTNGIYRESGMRDSIDRSSINSIKKITSNGGRNGGRKVNKREEKRKGGNGREEKEVTQSAQSEE